MAFGSFKLSQPNQQLNMGSDSPTKEEEKSINQVYQTLASSKLYKQGETGADVADGAKLLEGKYIGLYFSAHW